MLKVFRIALLSVLLLAGLACGLISNPISGAQNFASTAEAIASAIPSGVPQIPDVTKYLNPSGTPATDWKGVPIMTAAVAGEEFDANTYSFKASGVTEADIATFYTDKLKAQGWSTQFSAGAGTEGGLMLFTKGSSVLSITVAKSDQDSVVLLILH